MEDATNNEGLVSDWDVLEDEIDDTMKKLSSNDIEHLRATIFESQQSEKGKTPLKCDGLDDPPNPETIQDKFSAVLGDVFHAMDRAKVPIKHEAKKDILLHYKRHFSYGTLRK